MAAKNSKGQTIYTVWCPRCNRKFITLQPPGVLDQRSRKRYDLCNECRSIMRGILIKEIRADQLTGYLPLWPPEGIFPTPSIPPTPGE